MRGWHPAHRAGTPRNKAQHGRNADVQLTAALAVPNRTKALPTVSFVGSTVIVVTSPPAAPARPLQEAARDLPEADLVAHEPGDGNGATAYGVTELGSMLLPAFEYPAPFGQRLPSRV